MISICKTFEFEAAHYLPNHEGKCKNLHGHSYKLEVEVAGDIIADGSSKQGMVMDFGNLKSIVNETIIDKLDHKVLNDELGFYPTAENIAGYIYNRLRYESLSIIRIRLWETSTSWAEWKVDK